MDREALKAIARGEAQARSGAARDPADAGVGADGSGERLGDSPAPTRPEEPDAGLLGPRERQAHDSEDGKGDEGGECVFLPAVGPADDEEPERERIDQVDRGRHREGRGDEHVDGAERAIARGLNVEMVVGPRRMEEHRADRPKPVRRGGLTLERRADAAGVK